MPRIDKPLSGKCKACGGGGGRNVKKLETTKHMALNPKTGKKEQVITNKTVIVWEPCRACRGSGVG